MQSNESQEMYLETILVLGKEKEHVRSVDVANDLGFKKSSVSVGMKHLREKKYIEVDEKGYITLTPAGKEIAEMIYERHQFLSEYLIKIGVPEDIAIDDACKIEHVISQESFEALKKRVKNLK
ncbi:MAG: metal-dependent transcriptional regulator [Eubacterium sp.]|nr:metal-dependent transcriptional regulator [Eubacterium sp.]MBR3173171.1 metal-dependent transcriptional regulator [Eubacterium sp.]